MSIDYESFQSKTEYQITNELFRLINHLDANANLSLTEKVEISVSIQRHLTVLLSMYAIQACEHFFTLQDPFT